MTANTSTRYTLCWLAQRQGHSDQTDERGGIEEIEIGDVYKAIKYHQA